MTTRAMMTRAMTGPRLVIVPLLATIGLAGCERKHAPPHMPPPQVGIVTMHTQSVSIDTDLPGRTDAYEQAEVRPQVSGVIVERTFEQGADLKAGQLLYKINPAPYQAAYDQAKGQLANAIAAEVRARGQLERYKPLAAAHAVSRQDYDNALAAEDEARAQIAAQKGALDAAAVNLGYTNVRTPIAGRIGRALLTPGALVTANQTTQIAVVTRLDPIYVDVNLPAVDMLRFRAELAKGQIQRTASGDPEVALRLEDGTPYPHQGRLELSEVIVDEATGTLVMRAVFPNPDHLLLPGLFVHARVTEGSDPNTILVPQVAVQRDPKGDAVVMVVNADNTVQQRTIEIGRAINADWVATSGLNTGDRVIVSGLQKVMPGQKVQPVAADASKAG